MKLSAVITPLGGLRFVAVLVMCCAILAHISATEDALDGQRSEGNLVPRVFRLFGQRGNAGKTLGTSNFITAGFLR